MRYNDVCAQVIGCTAFAPTVGVSTLTVTGAASPTTYVAFGFTAYETGTLMSATFYFTASGTATTISLYADDGTGKPVSTGPITNSEGPQTTVTANTFSVLNFGPSSAGIAVTAGTRYHVVIKSYASGQNPTPNYLANSTNFLTGSISQNIGFTTTATTGGDAAWGTPGTARPGVLFTMSSGNTFGVAYFYAYSGLPSNSNIEYGNVFTSPPVWFATDALSIALHKSGAPTGDVTLKLYVNGALAAQSATFQAASLTTTVGSVLMPISRAVIPPNSTCRIVWAANVGDTSTNYLRSNRLIIKANGTQNTPLSAKLTSNTNGAGWVDDATMFVPFWLGGSFQQGPEFVTPPLDRRKFTAVR